MKQIPRSTERISRCKFFFKYCPNVVCFVFCVCDMRFCVSMHLRLKQNAFLHVTTCKTLEKRGTNFWKCWNRKLGDKNRLANTVNGISNKSIIAKNVATYFSHVCSHATAARAAELKTDYEHIRSTYFGVPTDASLRFEAELVESSFAKWNSGKLQALMGWL